MQRIVIDYLRDMVENVVCSINGSLSCNDIN